MHIKTQGLILRETNYKEADKILTVLTREGGRRTVKARGCRRKNSPLAASAQLLVWSDMTLFDYRDKLTLFLTREGFDESGKNQGFLPLGGKKVLVRLDGRVFEADLDGQNDLPADIEVFIWTVLTKYAYLLG